MQYTVKYFYKIQLYDGYFHPWFISARNGIKHIIFTNIPEWNEITSFKKKYPLWIIQDF